MDTRIAFSVVLGFTLSSSWALAGPAGMGKEVRVIEPQIEAPKCECFEPGGALSFFGAEFSVDLPGAGDFAGGGLGYERFLCKNFGLAFSAAWYDTPAVIHNYALDAIVRLPIEQLCLAPYVLVGGGLHTNGNTGAIGRLGGGLDLRFPSMRGKGIFADWIYVYTGEDKVDYEIARFGVKIPL